MLRRVRATARGDRALPGLVRGWGRQMAGPREISGGVPGLEGWGRPGEALGPPPGRTSSAAPERHPEHGFCNLTSHSPSWGALG